MCLAVICGYRLIDKEIKVSGEKVLPQSKLQVKVDFSSPNCLANANWLRAQDEEVKDLSKVN